MKWLASLNEPAGRRTGWWVVPTELGHEAIANQDWCRGACSPVRWAREANLKKSWQATAARSFNPRARSRLKRRERKAGETRLYF